jgi:hypothetical protein
LMIARFCCDPWTIPALNDGQYIHRNRVPIIANLRQATPRGRWRRERACGARPMGFRPLDPVIRLAQHARETGVPRSVARTCQSCLSRVGRTGLSRAEG